MGCSGSKEEITSLKEEVANLKQQLEEAGKEPTKGILLLGSTGYVGPKVAKALSDAGETNVFAGMRDTKKAEKAGLKDLAGVTPLAVDMGNKDAVKEAIVKNNIKSVFVIAPGAETRTEICKASIQGAVESGLKPSLVVLSVLTAVKPDTVFGGQFAPVEKAAEESGLAHVIIRAPLFTDNIFGSMDGIKEQQSLYSPAKPDTPYASVTTQDIGNFASKLLTNGERFFGKTINMVSSVQTHTEVTKCFNDNGVTVKYVQVDYAAAQQAFQGLGMPEWQAKGVVELYQLINDDAPVMSTSSDEFAAALKVYDLEPTKIQDYLKAVAPMFKKEEPKKEEGEQKEEAKEGEEAKKEEVKEEEVKVEAATSKENEKPKEEGGEEKPKEAVTQQ